jgi:adenine-specific DNA-methyltransferase
MAAKSIQYIGAKTKLLGYIEDQIESCVKGRARVVDLFSGSGVVTAALSAKWQTVSFDTEPYARVLARAFTTPYTAELGAHVSAMRDAASGDQKTGGLGLIAREYSPAGPEQRMFWTEANAAAIDAARQYIDTVGGRLSPEDRNFLVASLLVAADAVANCASVYGAYLKAFKPSARKAIDIRPVHTVSDPAPHGSEVLEAADHVDALAKLPHADRPTVVYADPPYNGRQYSANYAPLNVIASYDAGMVRGDTKTGLVREAYKSPFCQKRHCADAFNELREGCEAAGVDWLLVSYSDEGIVPIATLLSIFGDTASCVSVDHRRYASQAGAEKQTVGEYIIKVLLARPAAAKAVLRTPSGSREVTAADDAAVAELLAGLEI